MKDDDKHSTGPYDLVEPAKDIIRKASPLSISIAAVMATLIVCIAGGFWLNRDVLGKALDSGHELEKFRLEATFAQQKAELEITSLKREHDHCHETVDALTKRLEKAEGEIASLKEKQSIANSH